MEKEEKKWSRSCVRLATCFQGWVVKVVADCCRVLYVEDETLSETCLAGILLKSKKQGDRQRRSEMEVTLKRGLVIY